MNRHILLARILYIFCAISLGISASSIAQTPATNPDTACLQQYQDLTTTVGNYVFKTYRNEAGDACLQIVNHDKVIFQRTMGNDGRYQLGQEEDKDEKIPGIANGTDITGLGRPNMIVPFYTGGAHCCLVHYIFELEPEFRLLDTLNSEHSDIAHFEIVGKSYYLATNDWTFAYWHTSFADSPAPRVLLAYDGKAFHPAFDSMRKPAPTGKQWSAIRKESRGAFAQSNPIQGEIESVLWGNMLDLIYTGHSDLAWKLLQDAWPDRRVGKDRFLTEFCSQLKTSLYWNDLQKTLVDVPASCAAARRNRHKE